MTELRNLRQLYAVAKERIVIQADTIKQLQSRIKELEDKDKEKDQKITDLSLQMEELRSIVFGRKKLKPIDDIKALSLPDNSVPRSQESYKREVPTEEDVTDRIYISLEHHHQVERIRKRVYYVEDIPLPQKTVTKHTIEQGYCATCQKWVSKASLPSALVHLGERVRRYIVYLNTIARLSYRQIQELLIITYQLKVSSGEITKILKQQALKARPTYEALIVTIRSEPSVHLDETSWSLQQGDGMRRFGWAMVGGVSTDVVYLLGRTRGKGNVNELLGDTTAVVVSDDYGAYRKLTQPHQLCWAHIHRKLRDLATSVTAVAELRQHCLLSYQTFATIYTRLTKEPDYDYIKNQLSVFVEPHPADPTKLSRIKTQLRDRLDCYLTCLIYPNVTADNNVAERALRHVVLKRKVSFGSFSEETAQGTAVLLSVLMSMRNRGSLREWVVGV